MPQPPMINQPACITDTLAFINEIKANREDCSPLEVGFMGGWNAEEGQEEQGGWRRQNQKKVPLNESGKNITWDRMRRTTGR